jgi:predicted transcriptional regulator
MRLAKYFPYIFIFALIILSSFSIQSISNSDTQDASEYNLLIIGSDSDFELIDLLKQQRNLYSNFTVQYLDIKQDESIQALLDHPQNISQVYDEFWLITEVFPNMNLATDLINLLVESQIPGLIISSNLGELSNQTLNSLGILSCGIESELNSESTYTFEYSDPNNFSSLLGDDLPLIQSYFGKLELLKCELDSTAYSLLSLTKIDSINLVQNVSVLFQPSYKSNIIISPLTFDSLNLDNDETEETEETEETTSEESTTDELFDLEQQQQLFILFKTSRQTQQFEISIFDLFSLTSILNAQNWENFSLNNLIETINSPVSTPSSGPSINPYIDQEILQIIFSGSIILTLLSAVVFLLRRYGIIILGFTVGLLALFRAPSRKISVMEVYNNNSRNQILEILNVKKAYGESIRNISRELSIPLPTLLWHVRILEDFELIVKEKVRRELVILSVEFVNEFEEYGKTLKEFELTFKTDKAKYFFDYLVKLQPHEYFTTKSLVKFTNYSSRTIFRYLKKLLELGIIKEIPSTKNGKKYRISEKYYDKLKELN